MVIRLSENPNIYLILAGPFFIAIAFILVLEEGETNLVYSFLIGGFILFVGGYFGLVKTQNLKDDKTKKEIELINKKME